MQTFVMAVLVIGLVMAAMAVGLILRGRVLQGSCGGTGEGCPCSDAKRQRCLARHESQD
ncbi:MAG: hypothetical protein VCC04_14930 [Myxococcota bacterium]